MDFNPEKTHQFSSELKNSSGWPNKKPHSKSIRAGYLEVWIGMQFRSCKWNGRNGPISQLTITLEVLFLEWKKIEEEALQTEVGGIEK